MDEATSNKLNTKISAEKHWSVINLPFDVCTEIATTAKIVTINLAEHIGPPSDDEATISLHKRVVRETVAKGRRNKYYLPPTFNRNDSSSRKILIKHMTCLFHQHGGAEYVAGWKGDVMQLVFNCARYRRAEAVVQEGKENCPIDKKRLTSTGKPITVEELCKFRFALSWEESGEGVGRWFFYEHGYGCRFHKGHYCKTADEMKLRSDKLDEVELGIAMDGIDTNLSTQAMSKLFLHRAGELVGRNQLLYLAKKRKESLGDVDKNASVADQLIHMLDSKSDVSYMYITCRIEQCNKLMTVKKRKVRAKCMMKTSGQEVKEVSVNLNPPKNSSTVSTEKSAVESTEESAVEVVGVTEETVKASASTEAGMANVNPNCVTDMAGTVEGVALKEVNAALNPNDSTVAEETVEVAALNVYSALRLSGSAEILLAIAIITDEQRRFLELYPEYIAADVTEQTNAERRPLFLLAGKNASNETVTCFQAYLPSLCRWVFHWLWSTAVPKLCGRRFMQRNRVIATDGDVNEYGALTDLFDTLYTKTSHRLCAFHLIRQGMRSQRVALLRGTCTSIGSEFFDTVVGWIWSWTDSIESEEEYKVSLSVLSSFLSSKKVKEEMGNEASLKLMNFLKRSILVHVERMAYFRFRSVRCFGNRTTNPVEIEAGQLKTHSGGTRPNFAIVKSFEAMYSLNELRGMNKLQRRAKEADSNVMGIKPEYRVLFDKLHKNAAFEVIYHYERRSSYVLLRVSLTLFYVKLRTDADIGDDRAVSDDDPRPAMVPRFKRTRIVHLASIGQHYYLSCSCQQYEEYGIPCSHVFLVSNKMPMPDNVAIRWHKSYERLYRTGNKDVDDFFDQLIEREIPGPVIKEIPSRFRQDLPVGSTSLGNRDTDEQATVEFFESTLPTKEPVIHRSIMEGLRKIGINPNGIRLSRDVSNSELCFVCRSMIILTSPSIAGSHLWGKGAGHLFPTSVTR